MDEELLISDTVRWWAAMVPTLPPSVADVAVGVSLRAFAGGASFAEACAQGRRFLECCARHPAAGAVRAGSLA